MPQPSLLRSGDLVYGNASPALLPKHFLACTMAIGHWLCWSLCKRSGCVGINASRVLLCWHHQPRYFGLERQMVRREMRIGRTIKARHVLLCGWVECREWGAGVGGGGGGKKDVHRPTSSTGPSTAVAANEPPEYQM